jgi:hypothetical protein
MSVKSGQNWFKKVVSRRIVCHLSFGPCFFLMLRQWFFRVCSHIRHKIGRARLRGSILAAPRIFYLTLSFTTPHEEAGGGLAMELSIEKKQGFY